MLPLHLHLHRVGVLQAHLAPVTSLAEVHAVMATLLTNNKVQRATHNMMAYRIHMPERDAFLQVSRVHCGVASRILPTATTTMLVHRTLMTMGRRLLACAS